MPPEIMHDGQPEHDQAELGELPAEIGEAVDGEKKSGRQRAEHRRLR